MDLLCPLDRCYYNWNIGFLRNLENTVVERQKHTFFTAGTLWVNRNRDLVFFNQPGRFFNGFDRITGVSRSMAIKQHLRIMRPKIGILKFSAFEMNARS